jgi:hypothetical protein
LLLLKAAHALLRLLLKAAHALLGLLLKAAHALLGHSRTHGRLPHALTLHASHVLTLNAAKLRKAKKRTLKPTRSSHHAHASLHSHSSAHHVLTLTTAHKKQYM